MRRDLREDLVRERVAEALPEDRHEHAAVVAYVAGPVVCDAHDLFCELEGGAVLRFSWFE